MTSDELVEMPNARVLRLTSRWNANPIFTAASAAIDSQSHNIEYTHQKIVEKARILRFFVLDSLINRGRDKR